MINQNGTVYLLNNVSTFFKFRIKVKNGISIIDNNLYVNPVTLLWST